MTTSELSVAASALERCLESLLDDYRDLQHAAPDLLASPPSALDALRMVHKAHPTIVRRTTPLTDAGVERDWSKQQTYLDISGEAPVTIALTDNGLADSVRTLPDGTTAFVKPLEERLSLSAFFERLPAAPSSSSSSNGATRSEIAYLQSQDGNVFRSDPRPEGENELAAFRPYIERDVAWMKEAVGTTAEAVNLWIGTGASTTSLHHDPYDNVYHVLCGTKTFTLLSPIEGLWLEQHFHPAATLTRAASGLEPVLDAGAPPVPWVEGTAFPPRVQPIVVQVQQGEALFLPAGWWHRVEQAEGSGGLAVAVNYWYTADLRPERYAYERLAARIARLAGRSGVVPVDPEDTEDAADARADVWGSEGSGVDSADEWDPADWGR